MDEKKIRKLIEILKETEISEIEISDGIGKKIRVVQNSGYAQVHTANIPAVQPGNAGVGEKESSPEARDESKYTVAKSPMVGTFYRSPAPDESAFVSIGDTVKPGQTLCIIEAMKVMNEIESEVSGRIVEILVENANPVEFNQKLFFIDESS